MLTHSSSTARTILVADDDPDVLKITEAFFSYYGYRVLTARTAADCIALARRQKPDAIVLDLRLPDMDGLAVVRALKDDSSTRGLPILAVTGMMDARAEAFAWGCDAFLAKPVRPKELLERIEELIDEGRSSRVPRVADRTHRPAWADQSGYSDRAVS